MFGAWLILTKDNVEMVSLKTGKSMDDLEKILALCEKAGVYPVKIPRPMEPH